LSRSALIDASLRSNGTARFVRHKSKGEIRIEPAI
jgi:hypothetical protein